MVVTEATEWRLWVMMILDLHRTAGRVQVVSQQMRVQMSHLMSQVMSQVKAQVQAVHRANQRATARVQTAVHLMREMRNQTAKVDHILNQARNRLKKKMEILEDMGNQKDLDVEEVVLMEEIQDIKVVKEREEVDMGMAKVHQGQKLKHRAAEVDHHLPFP